MTKEKTNIQEEIEQMLIECRTLGIEVIFVSGTPGLTEDHKKIIISKKMSDSDIQNKLYKAIVNYYKVEERINKEYPGLKYEIFYNNVGGIEANADLQFERIKNKYVI